MTTPRGLTQPYTSFIGSACQGIHHAPSITNTPTTTHKPHNTKPCSQHVAATSELDKINKKKNHITHTRHHPQKQMASCEMLASTIQFSHNTPTSNKHHHNKRCSSTSQAHTKGDNAPDTQQCTNDLPINFTSCMHGHFYACHKALSQHLDPAD